MGIPEPSELAVLPDGKTTEKEHLIRQVAAWQPTDEAGAAVRSMAKQIIASCPGVAFREHPGVHLTASAAVLDTASRKFLVLMHPKYSTWLQPGGHCDGEPDFAAVALREATEECGVGPLRLHPTPLDVDLHTGEPGAAAHMHIDVRYLVLAPDGSSLVRPRSPEGHPLRWCDAHEMPTAALQRLASIALALHEAGAVERRAWVGRRAQQQQPDSA